MAERKDYIVIDLTANPGGTSWGPMTEAEADAFIAMHDGTIREGAYAKLTGEQWEASRKAGQVV